MTHPAIPTYFWGVPVGPHHECCGQSEHVP